MSRSPAPSDAEATCPCRLGSTDLRPYSHCCGPYHDGTLHGLAPTAEALMRSRYSAFVLNLTEYLVKTWHPSTRPHTVAPNEPGLQWLGLTVKHHIIQDENHAIVAFVARSKLGGRAHRLEETSCFVREDGRWFYIDGQFN